MKLFKRLLVLIPMLLLTSCIQPGGSSSSSSGSVVSFSASGNGNGSTTSTPTTTSFSQSNTDSTTEPEPPLGSPVRVTPKTSTGTSLNVYSVSRSGSSYVSTVFKTLSRGSYYTTYQDVAAYWIGFGELPINYVLATVSTKDTKKAEAYSRYGEAGRLWFTYHRTDGYMQQVPSYNTYGDGTNYATYYEFDISNDWSSYSDSRGALRLMAMPYGLKQYGVTPVVFYTSDHYASFTEYYNYRSGWGDYFTDQSSYKAPTTISVTY